MSALVEYNAHRSWTKQRGQEYVRGDFSDAAINELLAEVKRLKKEALHQYERYVAEQERTIVANQRAEAAEAERERRCASCVYLDSENDDTFVCTNEQALDGAEVDLDFACIEWTARPAPEEE